MSGTRSARYASGAVAVGVLFIITLFEQAANPTKSAPEPFPGFNILEGAIIILGIFVLLGIYKLRHKK